MKEINRLIGKWLEIKDNGRRRTVAGLSRMTGVSRQLIGHHLRKPEASWTGKTVEPVLNYLDEDPGFYEHAGPFNRGAVFRDAVT